MIAKTILILLFSLCVAGSGVLAADSAGGERQLGVQLEVKNPTVIQGEPIQLRTTLINRSQEATKGRLVYSWRSGGFDLNVAVGDEPKFHRLFSSEAVSLLDPTRPPTAFEYWDDRQILLGPLPAGGKTSRTDMLVFPRARPGTYRIRAVLSDPSDPDGPRYESAPVAVRIVGLEESKDPIASLCNQATLLALGEAICEVHWQWFPSDKIISRASFDQWISKVIADPRPGRMREPAMYAKFAMTWACAGPDNYGRPNEEQLKLAEQFVKEYPKSWLLPHVYAMLFDAYRKQGKADKAEEIRRTAIKAFPDAAVLRELRNSTAAKGSTPAPAAAPSKSSGAPLSGG